MMLAGNVADEGGGLLGDSLDDGRITFDTSSRNQADKRDPVCGKSVPAGTGVALVHRGMEYRFCSEACRDEFVKHPERYGG